MYLKSIEVHGFKSFAGRLVLEFNDGITGIVGPNGSGKSNVSDAVRWVLGEQSAKTLRGANMQDVIFSGTESRKALSFAYVCLTLDNKDHSLPLEFDEVSISRRIYRSGESEYQINKSNCRLKDIQELFYDTGIGKEGYSIIGQGQIERILSSKPEDRREIFDEAVGIVKYKKRKEASLKRLQEEEDNLVRIEDVLRELTDRIEPLREQAQSAREFLDIKARQKALDINLYLLDKERIDNEEKELTDNITKVKENTVSLNFENNKLKEKFDAFNDELKALDDEIEDLRARERSTSSEKGEMGAKIKVLEEKINSAKTVKATLEERLNTILSEEDAFGEELKVYEEKYEKDKKVLSEVKERVNKAREESKEISDLINSLTKEQDSLNKELLSLKDERSEINSERQKYDTRIEQININKATINQRQLERGTREEDLKAEESRSKAAFEKASDAHDAILVRERELNEKRASFDEKIDGKRLEILEAERNLASLRAQRETIKNIAERYEGYGGAVRHIMERRDEFSGVIGVIADLFTSEKEYEIAIETALGGALQNIVTEDEKSARDCVDFLKKNRHGRVTFLPVESVSPKEKFKYPEALDEKGAIGLASDLVECDIKFRDICLFLLGRILVCENLDYALKIAKKYGYRLNIVTIEGEQLRPGGSITGGNFKNNSNLLGRKKELESLLDQIKDLEEQIEDKRNKTEEYITAKDLCLEDIKELTKEKEESAITLNTAAIALKTIENKMTEMAAEKNSLKDERSVLEDQLITLAAKKEEASLLFSRSMEREEEIKARLEVLSETLDENTYKEETAMRTLSEIQIEEANAISEEAHSKENMERLRATLEKNTLERKEIETKSKELAKEEEDNSKEISDIRDRLKDQDNSFNELLNEIEAKVKKREEKQRESVNFIEEKDRLSRELSNLEKEGIRLDNRLERLYGERKYIETHIWEEYELTYHNCFEFKDESLKDAPKMRNELSEIVKRLRTMGPVNTAAIEEYAAVSERYEFLTNQCNDLREGKEKLLTIIDDLNAEMRERFNAGFAEISAEFNKVFAELFGGGEGRLELSDEDVLESGIRIVAQPPGKKLTNIMQMSGGEKSLTAIAILFSILNLKPSPFCLLDEIEAALDEPNVDRFAKYLNKLTEHTQFIIITHRRGTMNAADRLYGITMQEKGISTLVSVNLIEDELD